MCVCVSVRGRDKMEELKDGVGVERKICGFSDHVCTGLKSHTRELAKQAREFETPA